MPGVDFNLLRNEVTTEEVLNRQNTMLPWKAKQLDCP